MSAMMRYIYALESPAGSCSVAAANVANMMTVPVRSCGPRTGPVRDTIQGFTDAMLQKDGSVELRMTQVVAGFVIGPQGTSIRSISNQTGAEIVSWTEHPVNRRVFEIKVNWWIQFRMWKALSFCTGPHPSIGYRMPRR